MLIAGKMEVFIKLIGYYRGEAYMVHDVNMRFSIGIGM